MSEESSGEEAGPDPGDLTTKPGAAKPAPREPTAEEKPVKEPVPAREPPLTAPTTAPPETTTTITVPAEEVPETTTTPPRSDSVTPPSPPSNLKCLGGNAENELLAEFDGSSEMRGQSGR